MDLLTLYHRSPAMELTPCRVKRQPTDDAGKKAFFEEQFSLKETLHGLFGKKTIKKIFMINDHCQCDHWGYAVRPQRL